VLEGARRTHPVVRERGVAQVSAAFPGPLASEPFHGVLREPPGAPEQVPFGADDLARVGRLVGEAACLAGLDDSRTGALVRCVSELAANSVLHGGGTGILRTWREGTALVCEVRDRGALRDRLAGRIRPALDARNGRGVWFANAICDLVQIRSQADGTVVRVHMDGHG
jgi:anti-sigma regulatory factor (Ser/Thr protein kinase)